MDDPRAMDGVESAQRLDGDAHCLPGRERPARAEPPRQRAREPERETDDEGWNGPVPGFLGKGFGS